MFDVHPLHIIRVRKRKERNRGGNCVNIDRRIWMGCWWLDRIFEYRMLILFYSQFDSSQASGE